MMKKFMVLMSFVAVMGFAGAVSAESPIHIHSDEKVMLYTGSQWVCDYCGMVLNSGSTKYPSVSGWCRARNQQKHVFRRVR